MEVAKVNFYNISVSVDVGISDDLLPTFCTLNKFSKFEVNCCSLVGDKWCVYKVTSIKDTKVKLSNQSVNVVSHGKWWPLLEYMVTCYQLLYTEQIFIILS